MWLCKHCWQWYGKAAVVCAICQRPPKGRLCLSCKSSLPAGAVYCSACAGNRLSPAAVQTPLQLALPLRRALVVGVLVVAVPTAIVTLPGLIWSARVAYVAALNWQELTKLYLNLVGGFSLAWLGMQFVPSPHRERFRWVLGHLIRFLVWPFRRALKWLWLRA